MMVRRLQVLRGHIIDLLLCLRVCARLWLRTTTVLCSQVPNKVNSWQFEVEGVNVDLKSGTLTVAADNDEVVQNLCLAFSVAVLQVRLANLGFLTSAMARFGWRSPSQSTHSSHNASDGNKRLSREAVRNTRKKIRKDSGTPLCRRNGLHLLCVCVLCV